MKKARLDLLENIPDIDLATPEPQRPPDVGEGEAESAPSLPRRWAFNKILLIGAPVALILAGVATALIYFLLAGSVPPEVTPVAEIEPPPQEQILPQETADVSIPVVSEIAYLGDFMIDVKDHQGKSHILLFDLALFLGPDQAPKSIEEDFEIRNIIFKTAKGQHAAALKTLEARRKLKIDLADALNEKLGKGAVKKIYFTNYFMM